MRGRRIMAAIRRDLSMCWFHAVVNSAGGSNLLPRPIRTALYRVMGLDVRTANIYSGSRMTSPRVRIGARTFVNHDCYLDAADGMIEIGNDCLLGPQVQILTMTHPVSLEHRRRRIALRTVVEDRVWLGARCILTPGVRVGAGCVVAAGAVVTKDCEPRGVYAGVPARRVRDVEPVSCP